jgi:hypothetical protein
MASPQVVVDALRLFTFDHPHIPLNSVPELQVLVTCCKLCWSLCPLVACLLEGGIDIVGGLTLSPLRLDSPQASTILMVSDAEAVGAVFQHSYSQSYPSIRLDYLQSCQASVLPSHYERSRCTPSARSALAGTDSTSKYRGHSDRLLVHL